MIDIEMRRAHSPEETGERECAMCALPFRVESVILRAAGVSDGWGDAGTICPACLDYLRTRNPSAFPLGVEEYEDALKRYPEPIWGSRAEILALERRNIDAYWSATEAGELTPR